MALAPLYAGACRTGFVILTAKPIACHAQRASGGNAGQDEIAAAGALDVDPGRRQAPGPGSSACLAPPADGHAGERRSRADRHYAAVDGCPKRPSPYPASR